MTHFRSFDAGATAYSRYAHLVSKHNLPFVRAASSTRVVDSAANWTKGLFGAIALSVRPNES